jgi:hypothetical protein
MIDDPLDANRRGQVNADVGFSHQLIDEARVFDRALDELAPTRRQTGDVLGFACRKIIEQNESLAPSSLKQAFRHV